MDLVPCADVEDSGEVGTCHPNHNAFIPPPNWMQQVSLLNTEYEIVELYKYWRLRLTCTLTT